MDDIDLWIGGLFESVPNENLSNRRMDSAVDETFTCLLALQFLDAKRGDRFFYENAPNEEIGTHMTAFSMSQLNEIKKQSMSALICRNYDLSEIQKNPFFLSTNMSVNISHPLGKKYFTLNEKLLLKRKKPNRETCYKFILFFSKLNLSLSFS